MDIKSIILKKRNKGELTKDEILHFVGKYSKNEITEAQAGALMSYIYSNGMTEDEIVNLAISMSETGESINLDEVFPDILDKHSTGGVGDKTTLILIPVLAELGISVAKISNREKGIFDGTIDKLESIPGYTANISMEEFVNNIKKNGIGIISDASFLNPVESKLYKLRNQIACTDSLPIIAASLMSLKLSTGCKKIIFEISCGKGTYVKTKEEARRLAKLLIILGKRLKKDVNCVITDMGEPLGYSIGHNLEIQEAVMSLKGTIPEDLERVIVKLGSVALQLVDGNKDMVENERLIKEVLKSGKAYEKFKSMIVEQHGDTDYIENLELLDKAKHIMPVYATEDGVLESIDADIVWSIAIYLGAGRMSNEHKIDRTAGIVLNKKICDVVRAGEVLAYIHTEEESKVMGATENLKDAFKIKNKTDKKAVEQPMTLEIIT